MSCEPATHREPASICPEQRTTEDRGEDLAVEHLQRLGLRLLARNVHTHHGEIDLIACDARVLAFVEVKTLSVGPGAQQRGPLMGLLAQSELRKRAAAWLAQASKQPRVTIRFDAIGVTLDAQGRLLRLDHLEGAALG